MAQACRDGIRQGKAQLGLDLMKANMKDFYKYTNSKRNTRKTVRPWLSLAQDLATKDTEKVLHTFFALGFTLEVCPEASQFSEFSGRDWESYT